jgi:methyl-accepting chemotaxis protein
VNASVMATETASKTVEGGTSQFTNVSSSFRDIAVLVRTTNEAAREIELSTKQQSSAVEQVNRGVADVAQAAKETEVTSAQMLDTVAQLATLSDALARLVTSRRVAA